MAKDSDAGASDRATQDLNDESDRTLAASLLDSEERFRLMFEQSIAGAALVGSEGQYLMVNRAFCQIFGYSSEELMKMSFFTLTHPDDMGLSHEVMQHVIKTQDRGVRFTKRYVHKDGHTIWAEVHSAPVYDPSGKLSYFVTHLIDTSERVRAEAALAAEEERLSVTLRSIGDAVISTDTQGRVVMMNKVAESLTGWTSGEAVGCPLSDVFRIVDEVTGECRPNPVDKVLTTGDIVTLANHTVLVARDGTRRSVVDSGAPIRSRDSNIMGVVLVFRDNTDKQQSDAIVVKVQRLEALGVLAGGIAHDFNNLLSGIFGYLELARLEAASGNFAEVEQDLTGALSVFERARALTQQLLTFAKGGAPTKKAGDIGKTVVEATRFALSGSAVQCELSIADDLWPCEYDSNRIGQVVQNLVINAVQAMSGSGTLLVSAENAPLSAGLYRELPPGKYVRIAFRDQGQGIASAHLAKIFDPFFTTKETGHGLGLATCWSIVKRHDGHIDIQSELGKGSTFTIYLPARPSSSEPRSEEPITAVRGSGRILVMDDEDFQRDISQRLLSSMGFDVVVVPNGEQTVSAFDSARAQGAPFDVVIVDLTVRGGMGGVQTAERIRQIDPKAKVVVVSGYSEDPVLANPSKYGFDASLCKPVRTEEMSNVLWRLAKASRT